ncbi:MAG: protein adenylyltransferase SelO family protein [Sulfurimonas sp.]|nr:protein adenylyltransferase SelO family protein [Sulfurimonas sp.]
MGKGAIVLRLSPTWVRFGTFEYFNSTGEHSKLQTLADYVIDESFPHLKGAESAYLKMYGEIVKNTALTIAKWQSVGFNHGVMNTDNMSIDGRTIDYGPFAFLDDYKKEYICNHTDTDGQYRFSNQPATARWNLERLAVALSPIINHDEMEEILDDIFRPMLEKVYSGLMQEKLGLYKEDEEDNYLSYELLKSLELANVDYTDFFRKLSRFDGDKSPILDICINRVYVEKWLDTYELRLEKEDMPVQKRHEKMLAVNPKYVLKNHILQEAIELAQKDDFSMVNNLLKVAYKPFDEHKELEHLCKRAPMSSKNLKLSCSS